jgi:predicted TIM-barrel fold metal-dependent hydrolase
MNDLTIPPIVRYTGPIIEAHLHVRGPQETAVYVQMAEGYGVYNYLGISDLANIAACKKAWPGRFHGIVRLTYEDFADQPAFRKRTLELLRRGIEEEDIRGVKFWFKPQFNADNKLFWDDPRLDHIFDFMVEHQLVAIVHIADPDVWFERVYADVQRFGTKADTYHQLENRLKRHPGLQVQVAHLGGDPEHFDHLAALLESFPNLHFDLSATKWLARELSRKPVESREFLIRWADRLLFGSDLVVGYPANADLSHYASRYYVLRHLWEGRGPLPSPIADPDAGGAVTVEGLDLPLEVLEKIYRRNAERLYRFVALK